MQDKVADLVQVIVDNFDANISSQNGLQSTHGLAMLLTQPGENKESAIHAKTIPRIKKEDMVKQVEDNVKVHIYVGPHKPDMPQEKAKARFTGQTLSAVTVSPVNGRHNRRGV